MDKFKELEAQLQGVFGSATIHANGHEVTLKKRPYRERLVIEVYVDGWIKGEWSRVDTQGEPMHSEGRFYRPMRSRLWPLKQYNALKRVFGKREAESKTALRTFAVSPYWNSPRSLVSHLKKRHPDLELVSEEAS